MPGHQLVQFGDFGICDMAEDVREPSLLIKESREVVIK